MLLKNSTFLMATLYAIFVYPTPVEMKISSFINHLMQFVCEKEIYLLFSMNSSQFLTNFNVFSDFQLNIRKLVIRGIEANNI